MKGIRTMNSVERVLATLKGEIPDMIPIVEIVIEKNIREKIMPSASILDFYDNVDIDGIVIFEDIPWLEVSSNVKKDHFGCLRHFRDNEGDSWPLPLEPLIKNDNPNDFLNNYKIPNPHDPIRLTTLRAAVDRFEGKKAIIFGMHSSFLYPSFIRGFDNLLMDYIVNPDFAKHLTQIVVNYFVELEKHAIDYGADAIIDCEDYCSKLGPFVSEQHFREFILPGLIEVISTAKRRNIPFMKHSDGNVWPLLDMLVDSGINSYNPVETNAGMDIAKVKKIYGNKITLHGNVDSANLMIFGKPEDVKTAVKECIKIASPDGRFILSSSSGIHSHVKPENFLAMIDAARYFGRYPIKIKD